MSKQSISTIEDYHDVIRAYNPSKNVSRNFMTTYEKVKIVGLRAEQLRRGAPPLVEFNEKNFDAIKVATDELMQRKLPFMIGRTLPNGEKEYWRLDDMIIP
jgi:DNA-directed RNA polymerase I, II, and III subunit RPABC2